jgi:hypothetical protein
MFSINKITIPKKTSVDKLAFLKSTLLFIFFLSAFTINAQTYSPLRRPISPQQPMWIIHIDTWNYADPQKIIDLIPKDVRPFIVMNISLSISHNTTTNQFQVAEYGYEIAKSWVRTCAQNQMWAMVQVASGGMHQLSFSDSDLSVYEEFFRDYPNFIGFNYAEQFWGFDDPVDPISAKWTDRITHFADLLKLSNKYGGYLTVSWCGNQWGPSINPIGMLKRNPAFETACKQYAKNYILCEKYTQTSYISDVESVCLGAYLSGYSGQYGIRYDDTGWTDATGVNANFTLATAGAPHLEHIMLTGQTVIDGPEIIWKNCFKENNASSTTDGYTKRSWSTFSHFDNVMVDMFRKILDGTVRIPSRKEVIDRTKVVVVNDINSNDVNATYSSPQTLFEGLYRMDGDGNYENNKTLFKKTGRYPTIPTVYSLNDADANSFQVKINRSSYDSRWPNIASKVAELNTLFPQEYTGDLYVGRNENAWVTYNPYKTNQTASATIPFKYNTCDQMYLKYSQYTSGIVKEYPNKVTFYLCNYDDEVNTGLKSDSIKIYGCSSEPTWSYVERGNHQSSYVTKSWLNGVFTLAILHNGSVDITVNCSGTATGRLSNYTQAAIIQPVIPPYYTGPRQYEAECFDRKSVSSVVSAGQNGTVRYYTGQGYVRFGTNSVAAIRDTVNVLKNGTYKLQTKYSAANGTVTTVDLYVNGTKVGTPIFNQTASESNWAIDTQYVNLNAGNNSIEFKANSFGNDMIFDNIVVSQGTGTTVYDFTNDVATTNASAPAAQFITVQSGTAGVVSNTDGNSLTSNCFKSYSVGATNGTGVADLDLFSAQATNYSVTWKEYYGTSGGNKGVLLRGTGSSAYATALKQGYLFIVQNNADNTITLKPYISGASGITDKPTYTTSFTVSANKPCWYRATAVGNTLKFECSTDSVTWVGGTNTTFTDNNFNTGSTQLVWGLGTNNFSWLMDNITYQTATVSLSNLSLTGFNYTQGSGPSVNKSFNVSGSSLTDNIQINASTNYEVSINSGSGFATSLTLPQIAGKIVSTPVYVRLKSGLTAGNNYTGEITLNSNSVPTQSLVLSGTVAPQSITGIYDFTSDAATYSAGTPPALNTSVAQDNGATAGVVSYTDASSVTSNVLKPYSGGQRNATGVINLGLFSGKGADYSVTWKQYVAGGKDYKVGVLLRGDASKIGDASTGYVQGLMQGYLFIAYTKASGGSEFRIYKSTSSYNTLSMQINNTSITTFTPTAGQPIWYRASVSGSSNVSLKLEYSTDNVNWNTGATYNDNITPFAYGSTQLVWGLNVGNVDFYYDNITFTGTEAVTTWINPNQFTKDGLTVVSQEFYTVTGIRVNNYYNNLRGLYIVKSRMSDGSIISSKVLFTR